MTLNELNELDPSVSTAQFFACCASARWSEAMTEARPFVDIAALLQQAEALWATAEETERLAAFAAHPLIGDVELLRARFSANAATANHEQGQVLAADDDTLRQLAELNVAYKQRHGFIFIVCATGKSPDAMLAMLKVRLPRTTAEEIETAAQEQQAITRLRLVKLLDHATTT